MNPLELLRKGADGIWRTLKAEEIEEAEEEVKSNRAMRRAYVHMQKVERRGEGSGGTAKTERDRYGRGPRRHPHRAPSRRRRQYVGT